MKQLLIVGILALLCMSTSSVFAAETDHSQKIAIVDNYDGECHCTDATLSVVSYSVTPSRDMLHSYFAFDFGPLVYGGAYSAPHSDADVFTNSPYNSRAGPNMFT